MKIWECVKFKLVTFLHLIGSLHQTKPSYLGGWIGHLNCQAVLKHLPSDCFISDFKFDTSMESV